MESKGVQFPGRAAPDKLIGAANLQSPVTEVENFCLSATGTSDKDAF